MLVDANVLKLLPKQKIVIANMVSFQLEKALDWVESTIQDGVNPNPNDTKLRSSSTKKERSNSIRNIKRGDNVGTSGFSQE